MASSETQESLSVLVQLCAKTALEPRHSPRVCEGDLAAVQAFVSLRQLLKHPFWGVEGLQRQKCSYTLQYSHPWGSCPVKQAGSAKTAALAAWSKSFNSLFRKHHIRKNC